MEKYIMTYPEAPVERQVNAQQANGIIQGRIWTGGTNLLENMKDIFAQSEGPVMILEDDVWPCSHFNDRVNHILDLVGDKELINFFHMPSNNLRGIHQCKPHGYMYNQCTYYPSWFIESFLENYNYLKSEFAWYDHHNDSAAVIGAMLKMLNRDFYCVFPYLVKTIDAKSTLGHGMVFPQNKDFIDDSQS